jgi:NAD(P) transhydrogenase subunit beta
VSALLAGAAFAGAAITAATTDAALATSIADAAYVVAALLFILSLAGLSKHDSSRRGVAFGIAGMTIALAATVWLGATGS